MVEVRGEGLLSKKSLSCVSLDTFKETTGTFVATKTDILSQNTFFS